MIEELKQEFIEKIFELINQEAEIDSLYKQLRLFKNRGMSREKMLECLESLRENHRAEDRILELMDFVTGFCSSQMTVYTQKPRIMMPLYETEKEVLEHFLESVRIEEKISEDYLILYNFATDCKYAEEIQPQLLQYLIPFYLNCVRESVLEENPIARDVCWEFNTALFGNKKSIIKAVGFKNYQDIMCCYIELVLESMTVKRNEILCWVSFFNTIIALEEDNIKQIFSRVLQSTSQIKYAFFSYLTVLLFKEGDNLLVIGNEKYFWSNAMWDFEGGSYKMEFCWSGAAVDFYEQEVTKELIEKLFEEVKPILLKKLGTENTELFCEEMTSSFVCGFFQKRKQEFLEKISIATDGYVCWDVL